MEFEVPRVWFRLRLTALPARTLLIDVMDNRGRRWTTSPSDAGRVQGSLVVGGADLPFTTVMPAEAIPEIAAAAEALPQFRTGATTSPPLPIFIEPPEGLQHLGWESAGVFLVGPVRHIVVVESPVRGRRPRPLQFPLRMLLVGDIGTGALMKLRADSSWFRPRPGLVESVWAGSASGARALLRGAAFDIVITDGWEAPALIALGRTHRFALVVDPGPAAPNGRPTPPPDRLAGSTLAISAADPAAVITDFVECLAHDLPLHHAVVELLGQHPTVAVRLTATPESVHDLRLMDLYVRAVRARHAIQASIGTVVPPDVAAAVDATSGFTVDFAYESRGLHPLGEAQDRLVSAESAIARLSPDQVAEPGTRVLDLVLRRGEDVLAGEREVYVTLRCGLQAGARYHLDVRIGRPAPASIVIGPRPPLDPLLPDSRTGHDLDVVVHPGRFGVVGPRRRRLHLPPTGASDEVTVDLTAPRDTGPASLRVSVLHHDNLIQTYRLRAEVGTQELLFPDPVTTAELDHSATAGWGNVDRFRPRALALVLNATPEGSHELYLASSGATAELPVTRQLETNVLDPLRAALQVGATSADTASALRDLAELGYEAWDGLFNSVRKEPREVLRTLMRSRDEAVQITRVDVDRSLPWTLLYDWDLPAAPNGDVCWDVGGNGSCGHQWNSGVICVRGFWGVRHRIEERIGSVEGDQPDRIERRDGRLAVDLALGLDDDPHVAKLLRDLAADAPMTQIAREAGLLDRLWDTAGRAPVIAVVGHNDAAVPALDCGTSEGTLTPRALTKRARDSGDWARPGPLVLLLACESGTQTKESVTGHVKVLWATGASGVVATECIVYTTQVRAFTRQFLRRLVRSGGTLGAAMQEARQDLIQGREVASLGFVAFGCADLEVV